MRFVEPVGGEREQDIPDRLDGLLGVAVGFHPGGEQGPLLVHLLFLLLPHRAAQDVGAAEGVARQPLGDGHDLLLVDDQVVGLAEDRLQCLRQFGVDGLGFLLPGFAQRVVDVGLGFHRAGPAECEDGGHVLEPGGRHQLGQVPHHGRVELEDAEGLPGGEQFVGGCVVQRHREHVQVEAAVGLDVLDRVADDGQVPQAQEVHLQRAHRLAVRAVEPGDPGAVVGAAVDRHDVDQRLRGQDDPGGVDAGAADQALDAARGVDHRLDVGILVVHGPQLAGLGVPGVVLVVDRAERDLLALHRRRERLGDLLAQREWVAQDAAGILDRRLGLDRHVGDDQRDVVLAVSLGDVADHVAAAALVEVQVDVRHADALRIQEPLEQQAVLDRVQVGDAGHVGNHAAGR